jgi:cell pole-organizing protein PopZ
MSAANAKNTEPSMEEILASIRRIISDDQGNASNPEPQSLEADFDGFDTDVISVADTTPEELSAVSMPQSNVDDLFDSFDGTPEEAEELEFRDAEEPHDEQAFEQDQESEELELNNPIEPEPEPFYSEPAPRHIEAPRQRFNEERLISSSTDHSVTNAFNALAHTILTNNGRTLEDLVSDMMRPMLKNWLDDNLPTIVERLVRAEIERVARGGRG